MKKNLDNLVDRGCWISDDRVYAFVSSDGCISELGYHGKQPVSRNSRILVRKEGVLCLSLSFPDGAEQSINFREVDWTPSGIERHVELASWAVDVLVYVSGRQLIVDWSGTVSTPLALIVRVSKDSLYQDVQGDRVWERPAIISNGLLLDCHDRIMLRPWLERSGPYAGDFLIPEPLRRKLFAGEKRSGTATIADLRPEYRDTDLPLYDAHVVVLLSGKGFSMSDSPGFWVFRYACPPGAPFAARFVVQCSDERESLTFGDPVEVLSQGEKPGTTPRLKLEQFPNWEEFFETVPGLVDSCRIRDLGIPRATPGRYYWIWAWDMLVAVHESLRWGDTDLCRATVNFVNGHRDTNGSIPARWTRSLLPLDTPSPGGIEFLFAALTYQLALETGDIGVLSEVYPAMRSCFHSVAPSLRAEGIMRGEGFYPDLLTSFGRTVDTAVSMETGSWYSFCTILEDVARILGHTNVELEARECRESVAKNFPRLFEDGGLLLDAINVSAGTDNGKHPLFSLLFLHSSAGLPLVRLRISEMAEVIEHRFLTDHGVRLLPIEESVNNTETVLDSWYPYWDQYALKLLRRAGKAAAIMRWLRRCEAVLAHLGYCPEFLGLAGFRSGDPASWEHHGAASNLNCVTGWYRAIREAVFGIEIDGSGITHIPLMLPLGNMVLEGIHWRGGQWKFEIDNQGHHIAALVVDGDLLEGTMKIPISYATPGNHVMAIAYGDKEPAPHFIELIGSEVLGCVRTTGGVEMEIDSPFGIEGTFFSRGVPFIELDDVELPHSWDRETGVGAFISTGQGRHRLRLRIHRTDSHQEE